MSRLHTLTVALILLVSLLAASSQAASPREDATVRSSETVLKEFLALPSQKIPTALLTRAEAIAIVPKVVKVGVVLGGRRGKGVVLVKDGHGNWQPPRFLTLTGGSVGWQLGVQSTDVILVFTTRKSVEGLLKGKFTLGADAAAAAGPLGRQAQAATDLKLKAEIYSYSRSRGLFAGVSFDGSMLQIDQAATRAYYAVAANQQPAPGEPAPIPESAASLMTLVHQQTNGTQGTESEVLEITEEVPAPKRTNAEQKTEQTRGRLAQATLELHTLLGDEWKRFLALPAEVFSGEGEPSISALQQAKQHYDQVAADPRYRGLNQRREFQQAHELLAQYLELQQQSGSPKLQLPPPPAGEQKGLFPKFR